MKVLGGFSLIIFHIDKQRVDKMFFLEIDICAIALHTKWIMLFMLNGVLFQKHFADYDRFLTILLIHKKASDFLVCFSK